MTLLATFKHISSKNADYGAAEAYLTFEHDEFTMKATLDENGRLIPREDYRISSLNCGGEDFAVACMRANLRYEKNQKREDVKSHHYIISFDPRDGTDNGLTVDWAQELGEQFCKEHFPGHQALICTHPDGHNHSGNIGVALDFAKEAVKIAPVYYVTGNHEASLSQYDELKIELKTIGVIVLEDEAVQLKHDTEEITLIGLSDPDFTIKGDIFGEVPAMVSTKLNNLADDENSYTILLSHRPELFESYVHCNIDLVLSGHAHGGQFRLPFIGGLIAPNQGLFPQYDAGLYTSGSTNMIVSRGLGNSIIPIRFNNRPEVVVIELLNMDC